MALDTMSGPSCPRCGTPLHLGCEHSSETGERQPELTREVLADLLNLGIEVTADFTPTLETVCAATGAHLQPREDGFHITVIGPMEYKALALLNDDDIAELQRINAAIQRGEGVSVKGIGFIDGSASPYQLREVDKIKKTAFVALDIPELQAFRQRINLPSRDFHVTIGFEGGDIHTQIIGQEPIKPGSPKMKDITALIPKREDTRFSSINVPEMHFGGLKGPKKERK